MTTQTTQSDRLARVCRNLAEIRGEARALDDERMDGAVVSVDRVFTLLYAVLRETEILAGVVARQRAIISHHLESARFDQ